MEGMKPQSQHPETESDMSGEHKKFVIRIMLLFLFFSSYFEPIHGPCNIMHVTLDVGPEKVILFQASVSTLAL